MKTNIFFIYTILVTAGLACNQPMEPSTNISKLEQLKNQYTEVGKRHNQSLDHVLQSFDQLKTGNLTPKQIRDYTLENSRRQLKSYYESKEVKNLAGIIHDREAARVINRPTESRNNTIDMYRPYYARTLELPGLKEQVKNYIVQIGEVIDSVTKPIEIESRILKILNRADDDLSEEEFTTVFLAAEVGIASAHYWDKNGEKWLQKISELQGDENKNQDIDRKPLQIMYMRSIIKSDIAGAVGGAIGSAITGCAQLTVGACAGVAAAAGGLSGSATAAVYTYLDYIWESAPVEYPDLKPQMR